MNQELEYYLIADVGGTNINLGLVELRGDEAKVAIKKQYIHENSDTFYNAVNDFTSNCRDQGFETTKLVLACAGKIDGNRVEFSINSSILNSDTINKKTCIEKVIFMNDFDAIAYGIEKLKYHQLTEIKSGIKRAKKTILVIGPGTGLGKSNLRYRESLGYLVDESEGGLTDVSVYSHDEYELIEFIKDKSNLRYVAWEDVLSGRGIERIYDFLVNNYKKYFRYPKILTAKEISENQKKNLAAKETFSIFYKFLARACKNFAINELCEGGIYIAGGIVSNNTQINKRDFIDEFMRNDIFQTMLERIPIYLISDYDVSLYGLANYIEKFKF